MSHLRVIICRVEHDDDQMTELASFELADQPISELTGETTLDELETKTHSLGQAVMRELFKLQWVELDQQQVAAYRHRFSPWRGDFRRE